MANYSFQSITPAQALAFNPAVDTLAFTVPTDPTSLRIAIDGAAGSYVVTIPGLLPVRFGPLGLGDGQDFTFQLGGHPFIGGNGNDSFAGANAEFGGDGADTLTGGAGSTIVDGGAGADQLSRGPGAATFLVDLGQSAPGAPDTITDLVFPSKIQFTNMDGHPGAFEANAHSFANAADAAAFANSEIATGRVDYVATQVGADVYLFADDANDNGVADDVVVLANTTNVNLLINIVGAVAAPPATSGLPPPVLPLGRSVSGSIIGNMDAAHLGHLQGAAVTAALPGGFELTGSGGDLLHLGGSGFTYDQHQQLISGELFSVTFIDNINGGPTPANLADPSLGVFQADLTVPFGSVTPFVGAVQGDTTQQTFGALLSGNDGLSGSAGDDLIRGYAGDDQLAGLGGNDTIYGGTGNDIIYAASGSPTGASVPSGQTYLRGEEGDDYIVGGDGFDDANGNMGNDTISGGFGDDFSVGGKDNDLLFGDGGNDIVWGNLGNDTCDGGDGNDQCRGGQGDDSVTGGAGADFISGDRGNDTESGGSGADIFHGSQDAGIDKVLDFNLAEGDRVELDPGTTFTVSQVGADTIIDMGNGNQMILVATQLSSLKDGWIFGA